MTHTDSRPTAAAARPILVVSTGSTHASIRAALGDFHDWIEAGLGDPLPVRHLDATRAARWPSPSECAGVVIGGSHAMVTERAAWSERLAAWLRRCVADETPLLGICYGHQLLAHALGGRVGYRPQGLEIGTHVVERAGTVPDALFDGLPPFFAAQLVHAQSVLNLPLAAVPLARSPAEPHQAFRVGSCAWGVQFHPEFSAAAMAAYVQTLAAAGEPGASSAECRDTPLAATLLPRFAQLAQARLVASEEKGDAVPLPA